MNPLDNKYFTFFLNFRNENSFGKIKITEMVKFDGSVYGVKQESDRFGRDVSFMNENIDFEFYKGAFEPTQTPVMLPNGTMLFNLTMGFEQLLEAFKIHGFELDVEVTISNNGVEFSTGVIDAVNLETDFSTFVRCSVIQDTKKQIVKRREDIVVDLFKDKDLDDNDIAPVSTSKILLKSVPVRQISEWTLPSPVTYNLGGAFIGNFDSTYNFINQIQLSGVQNTLSYIQGSFPISDFAYIEAEDDLTNVTLTLDLNLRLEREGEVNSTQSGRITMSYGILETPPTSTIGTTPFIFQNFNESNPNQIYDINEVFTFENLNIPRGFRLYIFFKSFVNITSFFRLKTRFLNAEIKVTADSVGIDTVVDAVRYIDVFKQNIKSMSGLGVIAPKFDSDGKFYDQFCFTGEMIREPDNLKFPVKFKDLVNDVKEVAGGYQIINDNVYLGQYEDFYPNNEIAVLQSFPDESAIVKINERFAINQIDIKYKQFEQDKDEANTIDAVHTETQYQPQNQRVENKFKREYNFIRDPYKIKFLNDKANEAATKNTSLQSDDKMIIVDVVKLAPSSRGGLRINLRHNIDENGNLQLLNDGSFRWGSLGFGVGVVDFIIEDTGNAGTYTVLEITNNVLTLSGSPLFNSPSSLTSFNYPYSNVLYTNRTNEGFAVIENLISPDRFSNLRYTLKRNLKEWYSYIATICKFIPNKNILNTFFRNNGELTTRLETETENTIENANIPASELGDAILTPFVYELKLVVDWANAVDLIKAIDTVNDDDTIGGFLRTFDNNGKVLKGYPKELEYEPSTETLTVTLEEKSEGEFLTIVSNENGIELNEVGYTVQDSSEWYEISNGYLQVFDIQNTPIINPTRFDFVEVNGVVYESDVLLGEALSLLF